MEGAIGFPTARLAFSVGAKTALRPDKAKRSERSQPVKPLPRIRCERKRSVLWANKHIETLGSIFNACKDTRACSQFSWLERSLWGEGTVRSLLNDRHKLLR